MGAKTAPIAANLENSRRRAQGDADRRAMPALLARGVFAFESMRGGELAATVNLPGQAGDMANPPSPRPISPAC